MREIKFRAWDKNEQQMYANVHDTYDYGQRANSNYPADCFGDLLSDESIVVMQYTGLKDKNGTDIYEGDFIDTTNQKYFVQNGDINYYANGIPSREVKWITSEHHNGWNIYHGKRSQYEVIGNIYENPELLK